MEQLKFDALIIGAGPSGSAAAICLASKGFRILLVDKANPGRDKICGDALIPDTFEALEKIGCLDQVSKVAHRVSHLKIYAPNRTTVDIPGRLACLPRQVFDQLLVDQAITDGVHFRAETTFVALLEQAGRITGAKLVGKNGDEFSVLAEHVLLATGASSDALQKSGMCTRRSPSGVALRAYYELPQSLADEMNHFAISFEKKICPGYGWIFAGPNNIFNVGVGFFYDSMRKPPTENLRELWSWFLQSFEPATQIHKYGKKLSTEKGAPLRTALGGAKFSKPGLMLIGETIGTTYSFSGEGIGKAMQSGIMAAECISRNMETPEQEYETLIRGKLSDQYAAYKMAQNWLSFPQICNLLAYRANRGSYVQKQLEGLLAETSNPRELFSLSGVVKTMIY